MGSLSVLSSQLNIESVSYKMGELIPANTPIQMATVTDRTGYMHPKWFRYENMEQQVIRVDIERVMSQETVKYAGIFEKRFICSVVLDNVRYVIEFRYNIETQKWRIFQVISS